MSPLRRRRLAIALIATAALAAGLAALLRAHLPRGTVRHNATYLLDVAGYLVAVVGAVVEARVADLFLTAGVPGAKRRAVLFAVAGIGAGLAGCVTMTAVGADALGGAPRAGAAAVMVGGFGLGSAGLLTLAWHVGGRYAADRIQRLGEDDWN